MTWFEIVGVVELVLVVCFLLVIRFDCEEVGPDHPDFRR